MNLQKSLTVTEDFFQNGICKSSSVTMCAMYHNTHNWGGILGKVYEIKEDFLNQACLISYGRGEW